MTACNCPLCHGIGKEFYENKSKRYYQCECCKGVFLEPSLRHSSDIEKARYLNHNNDVHDDGYQQFVSPITSAVMNHQMPKHLGLDFGAGTGPVIAKVLADNQFEVQLYDPFFHPHPQLLNDTYDFIVCCEVMEHFYQPDKEFALLKSLLKQNGRLYCMTEPYHDDIDFHHWYYKKDDTHVFFYHHQSLQYIKDKFGFSNVTIKGRLIIYSN